MAEKQWFHGGGELGDVVDRRQAPDLLAVQDVAQAKGREGLTAGVEPARFVVHDEHPESACGVVLEERFRQHARVGEIVAGDDRAAVHSLCHPRASPPLRRVSSTTYSGLRLTSSKTLPRYSPRIPSTVSCSPPMKRIMTIRDV